MFAPPWGVSWLLKDETDTLRQFPSTVRSAVQESLFCCLGNKSGDWAPEEEWLGFLMDEGWENQAASRRGCCLYLSG